MRILISHEILKSSRKFNECFSPILCNQIFDRSSEKPRDCFGKRVLDSFIFFSFKSKKKTNTIFFYSNVKCCTLF